MAVNTQQIGWIFSPLQIGYIADVTEPLNVSSNVDWALENIADNPDIDVIPIERDGTVRGVLPREKLEKLAGSVWSKFWQKDLDAYIIPTLEILDATAYINKVVDAALQDKKSEISWYVVHHRGSYLGIVSLKKMLEYTNTLRNQDLHRAGEIQQYLLEKSMVNDRRFTLSLFNNMAHEVGGDFYRVYHAGKDYYLVSCFDVAGKNISGALTTMVLGACFASFELFEYKSTPDKMTSRINAIIKEVNPPGVFVAAVLFYVDLALKQIRVHNCGYSPVLIFVPQADNKISYKISNPNLSPLGIEDEYDFSDSPMIPISRGLRVCAYSDGLTDMVNIYGERYGEEQATRLIKDLHSASPKNIGKILAGEIESWTGTASLADDVTMVDIRFN
ncbi:MAG: serine/threonine-protein phosphatase [Spirochaetaceae bacterium]|jgi:sigma-B regulation protein RsbU (phosphoserine phosphatase)|nr:serine/threonine-protein phosphatase [Spirochaetaceae bacterium]